MVVTDFDQCYTLIWKKIMKKMYTYKYLFDFTAELRNDSKCIKDLTMDSLY